MWHDYGVQNTSNIIVHSLNILQLLKCACVMQTYSICRVRSTFDVDFN